MAQVGVHRQALVLAKYAGRNLLDALGHAGDGTTEAELLQLGHSADSRLAGAQRRVERVDADAVRRHHAEPRHDHSPSHRGTPIPESRPAQTSVPSSRCMRTSERNRFLR